MDMETQPQSSGKMTLKMFDAFKRVFDFVLSIIILALLLPLFAIVAVLIKRDSHGPVFFRQDRVGLNGNLFSIYKFRTMAQGSHKGGPQITSADDNRITLLGKRLRNLKIDELPQLINVLKGEMSLVGPRPQVQLFVKNFAPDQRDLVLSVRPGITGPTQLNFRDEEGMLRGQADRETYYIETLLPIKCGMDVQYVVRRSLSLDLSVLFQTFGLVINGLRRRIFRAPEQEMNFAVVEEMRSRLHQLESKA